MNVNMSDFKSNVTLKQVANFFNISISNVTNQSEVKQEQLFDLYEAYRTKEKEELMSYQTVAYFVGTLIMLSNLTVVISSGLILKKGQQPKSTYLLLGNVSLADTLVGFSIIFGAFVNNSKSSNLLCIFQIGMIVCAAMVSIFSVGFIAVDRYFYILHGLYYQRWFNTTRVRIGIICIWMIGTSLGFMPITGWTNQEFMSSGCYYVNLFPGQLVAFNSFISIIPIGVSAVLYYFILMKALKTVKNTKSDANVSDDSDTGEKPKLRIYRGNTRKNFGHISKTTKTRDALKRSSSLILNKALENERDSRICFKSKSINDLYAENAHTLQSVYRDACLNNKTNSNPTESQLSICTIKSSCCDVNGSGGDVTKPKCDCKLYKNVSKCVKNCIKPKEPNKWRAIMVITLTSGSVIVTWIPFFITVIIFVFCENKVTNYKCFTMRTLLAGPLAVLAFTNSIINPLIYAWWHKGFKRSIKTYFQKYIRNFFTKRSMLKSATVKNKL